MWSKSSPHAPPEGATLSPAVDVPSKSAHALAFRALLPPLSGGARHELVRYADHLQAVVPLAAKHRRDLPKVIAELSQLLTSDRHERRPEYLQTPRFQAAYCWYFLPWNLYRLTRLLTGLDREGLPLKPGDTILDVGAGPLTFAQALWLARPDLRETRLRIVAVDRAKKTMQTGRRLLEAMAGGALPWEIVLLGDTIQRGVGQMRGEAQLVVAANVLNEALGQGHGGPPLPQKVADILELLSRRQDPMHGRILLVEPGTRLGGTLISLAREALLEEEASIFAPCTHDHDCPLQARSAPGWCHLLMDVQGAPDWLTALGAKAKLPKSQASLSMLLAGAPAVTEESSSTNPASGRVMSSVFQVPGPQGAQVSARYVCAPEGLLLRREPNAAPPHQGGEAVAYALESPPRRDAKSGARLATPPEGAPGRVAGSQPRPPSPTSQDTHAESPPRPRAVPRRPRPAGGPQKRRGRRR